MPFLCGFISIVTLSYDAPRFVINKAIPIINSTFMSYSSRINTLGRIGFLLSFNGSHLPKVGYDPVGSMRMYHGHSLRASSNEPIFTDGNTSALESVNSATLKSVSLDPQWVTGFTDGEATFSVSV